MATPLYPILEKIANDFWIKLEREQITPWAFLTAGPPFKVTDFYGRVISYQGGGFEGSPRHVFWARYIEPFLESVTDKLVQEALRLSMEKRQNSRAVLQDASTILKSLVRRTYLRMAEIDRRLRGGGFPENVSLRITEGEELSMNEYIDRRIEVELSMQSSWGGINHFYNEHPFLFWLIGLLAAIAGIIVAV